MRSIPILFTPLPVNAPLNNKPKLKSTITSKDKANATPRPSSSGAVKPAKIEMAIDHLPPSLQKLHDENPTFAHALRINLAGVTKAAYDHDSDSDSNSDSDDDEYQSEGLRFKRYMDKMHGIKLGKEAYRLRQEEDEDNDSQDGADQDAGFIPTIWKENGEVKAAPPNDQAGEEAIGDLSEAYRVSLRGKSPVRLKVEDEPVLANEAVDWSKDWEQDFDFQFNFDQDVVETPDLSTGDISCTLSDSPPLATPNDSPCISRTKSLYNIQQSEMDDEDDEDGVTPDKDHTPSTTRPMIQGATRPSVEPPMIAIDPHRTKYTAYSTLVRPREIHCDIDTIYEESMANTPTISINDLQAMREANTPTINSGPNPSDFRTVHAAETPSFRSRTPAIHTLANVRLMPEVRERRVAFPTKSGVQILRNGKPIYGTKRTDPSQVAERVLNPILKSSDAGKVKSHRPSVRFNPELDYSATPPPMETMRRHRPVTYASTNAKYYKAAMRRTPVVPEPIGAPLINIMIDTLTPVACHIAKNVQIGFNTAIKNVSDAIEGMVPHHPGIERAGSGTDGRRLARIHKGLNF